MSWKGSGEGRRRRPRYEPVPPDALDDPFGPPPAASLSHCPVYGEEMLVHEAIMDVAIGAAPFRGDY